MKDKHAIFHAQFVRARNHSLGFVPNTAAGVAKYSAFMESIQDGQTVEVFMEANVDDGTVPQLAKVHACIRELAKDLGYTFEDMKIEVKRKAGLCVVKVIEGERYMFCKSFGDCSKSELSLVMETVIQIGDTTGSNLR